uniref:Sulfotransferase n=1 Tax=Knipowitschia caucasica TaxID=637954 RepID=A0AAV2LX00_KNICA
MSQQQEKPQRPPLIDFNGVCFSKHFTDNWENVQHFKAKPDDILIATYPKAVVFGSWYNHVNNWWKKKQTYPKIHFMFYEDLIEDSSKEILRLCDFLGLSLSAEELEKVKTTAMFDNMKQNQMISFTTAKLMDQKLSPFLRKGKVGDWKNHFTVGQNEEFDEDYRKKMEDSQVVFWTCV